MADIPQKQIFLSYAWANKNVADEIDSDFQKVGITFRRDIRDINYLQSIKDFMHLVGESNHVVMIISDEYIKSENCMYEVIELLNRHEFEDRILPVILENADIFSRKGKEKYFDYWSEKVEEAKSYTIKHPHVETLEEKRRVENIYSQLSVFLKKITELKMEKFENLRASNYTPMLKRIGIQPESTLSKILSIDAIDDIEEREIALETIEKLFPADVYVMFYKASLAEKNKMNKKAKHYYEILLTEHPNIVFAHNNFAVLLEQKFNDYEKAQVHYEKAIDSDPNSPEAYFNLALLLADRHKKYAEAIDYYQKHVSLAPHSATGHFKLGVALEKIGNIVEAQKNYLISVEIDPKKIEAYVNLGLLLYKSFNEGEKARYYYEKAIEIDPNSVIARNNLAILLHQYFHDSAASKLHYERAIELDPNYAPAYNNLASLIQGSSDDYKSARALYEKAIQVDPQYADAFCNLATLISDYFKEENNLAKYYYEKAIELNPKHSEAHNNFAILLYDQLQDYTLSREHYEAAIMIDPKNAESHNNYSLLLATVYGEFELAKKHIEIALTIDPDFESAKAGLNVLNSIYFG